MSYKKASIRTELYIERIVMVILIFFILIYIYQNFPNVVIGGVDVKDLITRAVYSIILVIILSIIVAVIIVVILTKFLGFDPRIY